MCCWLTSTVLSHFMCVFRRVCVCSCWLVLVPVCSPHVMKLSVMTRSASSIPSCESRDEELPGASTGDSEGDDNGAQNEGAWGGHRKADEEEEETVAAAVAAVAAGTAAAAVIPEIGAVDEAANDAENDAGSVAVLLLPVLPPHQPLMPPMPPLMPVLPAVAFAFALLSSGGVALTSGTLSLLEYPAPVVARMTAGLDPSSSRSLSALPLPPLDGGREGIAMAAVGVEERSRPVAVEEEEEEEEEEVEVNDAEADKGEVGVEKQNAPSAATSMATAAAASRCVCSAPLVSARARKCVERA